MGMNRRMAALQPPSVDALPVGRDLDAGLAAVLDDGFEQVAGCVVFSRFADSARRIGVAQCGDETGFEAFVNHVHVEDELPAASPSDLLEEAGLFVSRLADQLKRAYPDEPFVVILAVSDSCTVRFHKVRTGQSWLADDIEDYDEAVMSLRL